MSSPSRARTPALASAVIAGAALLLVVVAFLLGYLPGDARGATRRNWTVQTGSIALALALLSFLPLGWLRWALTVGAGAFLALSLTFWLTVGR